jgi:hypothetical protein
VQSTINVLQLAALSGVPRAVGRRALRVRYSELTAPHPDLAEAAERLLDSLRDLRRPQREGPTEAAARIDAFLAELDRQSLQGGDDDILSVALDEMGVPVGLVLHLKKRGLDSRLVLPSLPGHAGAIARRLGGAVQVAEFPAVVRRH